MIPATLAESNPLAFEIVALLATAAVVGIIFRRFNLQIIPGYLLAGAIVGPHALRAIADPAGVDAVSSLAVILLMFTIGLELDVRAERRGFLSIAAIGAVSTIASTLVSLGLLWAFRVPLATGFVLAMACSMSSTAVLVRTLITRREAKSMHARLALGIAVVQDIAAVIAMALVPVIAQLAAGAGAAMTPLGITLAVARGVGGVIVIILAGHYLLPRLLYYVSRVGSAELVLVVSAAVALGAAVGSSAIGFSPEMGAFLAGLLLGLTPFRYQLAGQFSPLRDLLMAVFFTAVGMQVDPHVLIQNAWQILLGAAALIALKPALIALTARRFGAHAPVAMLGGVYLGNAGEFSLVLIASGAAAGLIPERVHAAAIGAIILSLTISPMLFGPAHAWRRFFSATGPGPAPEPHEPGERSPYQHAPAPAQRPALQHVIIAGFGVVGRALADRFGALGVPLTIVELNPRTVVRQTGIGRRILYGDITNPEVLERAGVRHSDAVFITIPEDDATMRACSAIRELSPEVFIAARTSYLSGKFVAHQLGADLVTVEEIATAHAMEQDVLARLPEIERRRAARDARAGDPPTP